MNSFSCQEENSLLVYVSISPSLLLDFITGRRNEIQLILHFWLQVRVGELSLTYDDGNKKASLHIPNDALHIVIAGCNLELNITKAEWLSNMKAMVP